MALINVREFPRFIQRPSLFSCDKKFVIFIALSSGRWLREFEKGAVDLLRTAKSRWISNGEEEKKGKEEENERGTRETRWTPVVVGRRLN